MDRLREKEPIRFGMRQEEGLITEMMSVLNNVRIWRTGELQKKSIMKNTSWEQSPRTAAHVNNHSFSKKGVGRVRNHSQAGSEQSRRRREGYWDPPGRERSNVPDTKDETSRSLSFPTPFQDDPRPPWKKVLTEEHGRWVSTHSSVALTHPSPREDWVDDDEPQVKEPDVPPRSGCAQCEQ